MKAPCSGLVSLTLLSITLAARVEQVAAQDALATGRTYDPLVEVEKRYPDTKGGYEIWLVNERDGTEQRLHRTPRSAYLRFSQDMNWVVVNDAIGSGTTRCLLFRREGGEGGVTYSLHRDLTDAAWKFFEQREQVDAAALHHRYVRARAWLEDPQALLVSLIGHGDRDDLRVRYWTCVYDLDTEQFTLDLGTVNRPRLRRPEPKAAK